MWDPCIPEATEMFERMTKVHKRELVRSRLLWKPFKDDNGVLLQLVPVTDLIFKF